MCGECQALETHDKQIEKSCSLLLIRTDSELRVCHLGISISAMQPSFSSRTKMPQPRICGREKGMLGGGEQWHQIDSNMLARPLSNLLTQ